jgi:hypothetical protein
MNIDLSFYFISLSSLSLFLYFPNEFELCRGGDKVIK